MHACKHSLALFLWITAANLASAGELELFNARTAPEEGWSWSDARIRKHGNHLQIVEINKQGDVGNVFVEQRFPYHPRGEITLHTREMAQGVHTFQVMGFAGDTPLRAVEPVKDASRAGSHVLRMRDLRLPPETQSVLFKIWVGGAEGAALELEEFRYVLPVDADDILVEERFGPETEWIADDVVGQVDAAGLRLTLAAERSFGSVLINRLMARHDASWLLLHLSAVEAGTITVQFAAFDGSGDYLDSIDAIPAVVGGWHGVRLGDIAWPAGTAHFRVKVWLGGSASANAVLARLLVLKDEAR
ncbi:MAG TPA: hypothetical protein PKE12_01710 [Kiritimatiellia bacterium]|nr:hypothetical protein [Kiritimatiellia bacterium]